MNYYAGIVEGIGVRQIEIEWNQITLIELGFKQMFVLYNPHLLAYPQTITAWH